MNCLSNILRRLVLLTILFSMNKQVTGMKTSSSSQRETRVVSTLPTPVSFQNNIRNLETLNDTNVNCMSPPSASSYSEDGTLKRRLFKRNTVVAPRNIARPTTQQQTPTSRQCRMVLVADDAFVLQYASGNKETARQLMLRANLYASTLYQRQFGVTLPVIDTVFLSAQETAYAFKGVTKVSEMLSNHQQYVRQTLHGLQTPLTNALRQPKVCLVHLFTARNFGNLLGESVLGHPDQTDAGGICGTKGYNTGVTNTVLHGRFVDQNTLFRTFTHEISHNFGAMHDGEDNNCRREGTLMSAVVNANSGGFSECSLARIRSTIQARGNKCFV